MRLSTDRFGSFYIESLGCAKNQVDSEVIVACLEKAGLRWVHDPAGAELIIINTCGFIAGAKEESIRTALEIRNRYPDKKVIMTGCLVQRYERDLRAELSEVDEFIGNRAPERFALNIAGLLGSHPGSFPDENLESLLQNRQKLLSFPGSAFVKLAEGCSNFCSYCAIPLIRENLKSRLREDILSEIRRLLAAGVYELNLVAQDLGAFGMDRGGSELPRLLEEISALEGRFWLRLLYLHPDHFPADILDIISTDSRLLPYFEIPFQHASKKILTRMGRTGSKDLYLALIGKIRERLPEAVIRSTFMVGFPGETDEDFQSLLEFQKQSSLDWLGVFVYSREEGTAAFNLGGRVKQKTARSRKSRLEELQIPITEKRLDTFPGRSLELLVEEQVKSEDMFLARAWLQAPEVDGLVVVKGHGLTPGSLIEARIIRRNGLDLEAVPCNAV